jgi:hypothetical protein
MGREGLAWLVLSVDYQRIVQALTDRYRFGQGPLTCQEMTALFGLDALPAKVEAPRSKAKQQLLRRPSPGLPDRLKIGDQARHLGG